MAEAGDLIREVSYYRLNEPGRQHSYTVLRLETNSGIAGYGECDLVGKREISAAETVLDRPATAVEEARKKLSGHPRVQAAVNMALLDIAGKMAKAPVYQLLGGPTRHKVRAMVPLPPDSEREALQLALKAGYRAFAAELPQGSPASERKAYLAEVREKLAGLRAAAGDGTDFVLRARNLTPGDAATLAATVERERLLWLDEPCPISNMATLRKISEETVTPIGLGWAIDQLGPFQDLLREGVVDVLRPRLNRYGITQIRRLAAMAETYYVAVAPTHHGGPIGTAAALHLAASLPNFFILEMPPFRSEEQQRMRNEIVTQPVENVEDGFLKLPTGPGLGVEINEAAAAKYKEDLA